MFIILSTWSNQFLSSNDIIAYNLSNRKDNLCLTRLSLRFKSDLSDRTQYPVLELLHFACNSSFSSVHKKFTNFFSKRRGVPPCFLSEL